MSFSKPFLYLIGGLIAFACKIGITVLFVQLLNVPPVTSYIVAVCFNIVFTYVYNHFITFEVNGRVAKRFTLYSIIVGVAYALDIVLMGMITSIGVDYRLSVVLSTASLFVGKYLILRRYVFGD